MGLYGLVRKALRTCKSSPIEKDRSQDKDSQSAPSRENKAPESMVWEQQGTPKERAHITKVPVMFSDRKINKEII